MTGSISPRDPHNIRVAERRAMVLDLRKQGLNFREIVTVIRSKFGDDCPPSYNERHCWFDLNYTLKTMAKETAETADEVVLLEVERLDELLKACMNKVYDHDAAVSLKAVDRVLAIMKRRASLLGLDKPATYVINTWQNEVLQLLKQGKLTIGQVRQELGDELTQRLLESGGISLPESGTTEDTGQVLDGEFVASEQHS